MGSIPRKWKYAVVALLVGMGIAAASCGHDSLSKTAAERADGGKVPKIANPAAVKCVEDGYQLSTITENGVPTAAFCYNPENGKKCEVWQYFRGECHLEKYKAKKHRCPKLQQKD